MTSRREYILRLAVVIAKGSWDDTATEAEIVEAHELLERIGVLVPEPMWRTAGARY
jgi:hypothetical protein